jgi:hypothetical protein
MGERGDSGTSHSQHFSWILTYMLVGAAKECKSVGRAGADHQDFVEQVINELLAAMSAKEGITFQEGSISRLAAYTDVVADFLVASRSLNGGINIFTTCVTKPAQHTILFYESAKRRDSFNLVFHKRTPTLDLGS